MALLKTRDHLPVSVQLYTQLNDVYHIETQIQPSEPDACVLPRIGTLLNHAREALDDDSVHLCVPGDFLSPSCLSKQFKGAQMVDVFNALGTRCVCFGNHEFDEGLSSDEILARMNESKFTWLNTNLQFADQRLTHHERVKTSMTMSLSDTINIGIIGLIYEHEFGDIATAVDPIAIAELKFNMRDLFLPSGIASVKERVYIALTHMAISDDDKLARTIAPLLLIMGGHDHEYLRRQDSQRTMIVKSLSDARSLRLNWVLAVDHGEAKHLTRGPNELVFKLYTEIVIPNLMKIILGAQRPGQGTSPERTRALLEYLGVNAPEFLAHRDPKTLVRDTNHPLKGESQDAGLITDSARIPMHIWSVGQQDVLLFSVALRMDDRTVVELIAENAGVRAVIEKWLMRSTESSTSIMKAPTILHLSDPLVRRESTNFGSFVADVVSGKLNLRSASRSHADIGLVNGGSFRLHRDIAPGEALSQRLICDILFHSNPILLFELTGGEIKAIVEKSLSLRASSDQEGHGDFLQVSGIRIETRGQEVAIYLLAGSGVEERLLQTDDIVKVATTKYVALSCSAYHQAFGNKTPALLEDDIKAAVTAELKAMGGSAYWSDVSLGNRWKFITI